MFACKPIHVQEDEGGRRKNTKTNETRHNFQRNYGCLLSQLVSGERRRPETRIIGINLNYLNLSLSYHNLSLNYYNLSLNYDNLSLKYKDLSLNYHTLSLNYNNLSLNYHNLILKHKI